MTLEPQEEQCFITLALEKKFLTKEQVEFCRSEYKENPKKSFSGIAVEQGFITPDTVVDIFKELKSKFLFCPGCGSCYPMPKSRTEKKRECEKCKTWIPIPDKTSDVVVVEVTPKVPSHSQTLARLGQEASRALEKNVVQMALDENLITSQNLDFCIKERDRLMKEGINPQIPSLLYSTGLLKISDIQRLYTQALRELDPEGLMEIALAYTKVSPDDMDVPRVLKAKSKAKKPSRKAGAVSKPAEVKEEMPQEISFEEEKIAPEMTEEEHEPIDIKKESEVEVEMKEEVSIPQGSEEMFGLLGKLQEKVTNLSAPSKTTKAPIQESEVSEEPVVSEQPDAEDIATKVNVCDTAVIQESIKDEIEKIMEGEESQDTELLEETISGGYSSQDEEEIPKPPVYKKGKEADIDFSSISENGCQLDKCNIKRLDLTGLTISGPIQITNSNIEEIIAIKTIFRSGVDFSGTRFGEKAIFREASIEGDALFKNTHFKQGADFSKTEFKKNTHFNSAAFSKFVSFNKANFQDKTVFTRAQFNKGVKFAEVMFSQGASFNDTLYGHRFYMEKCTFDDEVTFSGAHFLDMADFSKTEFKKECKFITAIFEKWVSFHSSKFGADCHFKGASFDGDISFESTEFNGLINLKGIRSETNVSFKWAVLGDKAYFVFIDSYMGRIFIAQEQIEGHLESFSKKDYSTARKEFGLLKNHFREASEYEKEDWAYLMEKRMERKNIRIRGPISIFSRFFNWLTLDIACGYGTKPLNIFLTSIAVLLIFALAYYMAPADQFVVTGHTANIPFMESVLLSFKSFTNAGVESWQTAQGGWINYVMMMESFIGLFVIAVLVVTFSRKVIR